MLARLNTFLIYSILFIITICFFALADKNIKYNKFKVILFSIIAILLPCIMAGVRAETVGTDIRVYAKTIFYSAVGLKDFTSFMATWASNIEIGYLLLAYCSAKISSKLGFFLFFTQFVTILPVYVVAYKRKNKNPIWITMMVYLLVFYIASFNLMRQSICAAWLLLAYQLYEEKKYKQCICIALISYLFHNSAVITILLIIIVLCIQHIKIKGIKRFSIIFIPVCIAILLTRWNVILTWFISSGMVRDSYRTYIDIFSGNYNNSQAYYFDFDISNYFELFFKIIFLVIAVLFGMKKTIQKLEKRVFIYVLEIVLCETIYVLIMIFMHSIYGIRISYNSEFFLILLLPTIMYSNFKRNRNAWNITLDSFVTIFVLLSYFIIGYCIFGWHGTFPFKFAFG